MSIVKPALKIFSAGFGILIVSTLVSLQKKNTFEAAARSAAVSATRWKARVYAVCGFAAAHPKG